MSSNPPPHLDEDHAGMTFGQLTLVRPTEERIRGQTVWECRCTCGNTDKATLSLLRMGRKTSCGCMGKLRKLAGKATQSEIEKLKAIVEADGRSVAELARSAGLSEPKLNRLLAGHKDATLETVAALLKILGKRWGDLEPDQDPETSLPRASLALVNLST